MATKSKKVIKKVKDFLDPITAEQKSNVCSQCHGTGRHLPEQTCPTCKGTGK